MAKGVRVWVLGFRDLRSKVKMQRAKFKVKGYIIGGFVSRSSLFHLVISVFKARVKQVMFIG